MPHNLPPQTLSAHLRHAQADALVAEAGSFDVTQVTKGNEQLSLVLWVAKLGSRHMDWNEKPKNVRSSFEVAVWHELVEEHKDLASLEVPEYDPSKATPALSTAWPSSSQSGEFIEFQSDVSVEFSTAKQIALTFALEPCVRHCRPRLRIAP